MATRFEILLYGGREADLRAAAEEALDEVDRLESQLSLYRPASEIAVVNRLAARQPVRVSPSVFDLLSLAQRLHQETAGAFDITIGPLVRCWGFMGGTGSLPTDQAVAEARNLVGMYHVKLDRADCSVRFDREGVMIDLGAIGKGYAIDCAVQLLRDSGMTSGLIHGGTSTTYALGTPPEAPGWRIELPGIPEVGFHPIALELRDEALSVSAVWGRSFTAGGKAYGHVLDPRTGQPVEGALCTAVGLPSATETDALSTALLVAAGTGQASSITELRPNLRHFVARKDGIVTVTHGKNLKAP
jgi:thiamine biosynthesis lipoprotein